MPARRSPNHVAEITGARSKNPQRYRDRVDPATEPLGDPPHGLPEPVRVAWLELAADLPWLGRSDRKMLELCARLSILSQEPGARVSVYAQFRLALSSLGATPVDRSKVAAPAEDPHGLSEFFN